MKKVDRFEVNTVDLGSWRTLRLDGIKKNKDSIQKNRVLDLWLLEKREDSCMLDCNHRNQAFLNLQIPTALGLIFPKLTKKEYDIVAGVANEFHDESSVKVTDWDKYYVIVWCLEKEKLQIPRNYNIPLIVETLVSLFPPHSRLYF